MNKRLDYKNLSDDVLIRCIINGDDNAFQYFVETYNKKIFNISLRIMNNYEDACDLTQEIFLKIYQKIDTFKGNCSLSTWIYRISTNTCIDELRRRKNINLMSIDASLKTDDGDINIDFVDEKVSTEDLLLQKEMQSIVNKSISKLPDVYRILLILREFDDLSYEEIAGIVRIPIGTVKSRINRARSMLRELLKEGNYFD